MRSTTAILLTLALFGVGTCTSNLNDLVFAEEWESVLSQMKDDSVIMADPKPPTFAFVSSNNGSTHQEIIQELGLSMSEIQRCGCSHSAGTYGGSGGGSFNEHHCSGKVSKIVIRAGSVIDSIQLTYKLSNGHYTTGKCFGGRGGKQHVINIDVNRGEKIIGVFGRNGRLVDQLGFVTNKGRIFGPYGSCGGGKFTVNSCEVRGIFGRSGSLIDSIGFFCGTVQ